MPPLDPTLLLAALDDPAALCRDGRIVAVNDALTALLGDEDALGRRPAELDVPDAWMARERPVGDAWSLATFARPRGIDEWLGRMPDADVATLLLAHRRDPVSLIDRESGRFVDVSDAWCRQYGWSREEAVGRMGPADVSAEPDATMAAVGAVAEGADAYGGALRWHRRRDGTVFPVELQCGVLELDGRKVVYARLRDVEERVRAEDALRRSEARFRELIEQLPHAVIVHRGGYLLYLNPAARALLGFGPDEDVSTVSALEIVHPDDREMVRARVDGSVYAGLAAPRLEERLLRRDGTEVTVEVVGWPVHFDGAPAALAMAQDVTDKKRMESQLMMADRLASLGRLAASVGHEINNPLAYVLGSLEVLRRELDELAVDRPDLLASVDAAEHGALRVRDIVRDLKALSRGDDRTEGPADLGRALDACVQMASLELKHRAEVVRDYGRGVWVAGGEGRIGQLFLNLLVNAAQAIEEGARAKNQVRIHARVESDHALVEIADTGRGLPDRERDRIFEPFFTTKRGSGTGLGLSICHHIVESLGGSIEARPRTPRGTVFRVRLPLAEAVGRESVPAPESVELSLDPDRRALIVDDEPAIRDLIASWLDGWDVVTAESGRDAIARLERDGPFDVIVCDLMMDDLTGVDVHERIASARPGQERRVIFTTGGAFTPRAKAFLETARVRWLDKPFRRSELLARVRAVLDDVEADQPGGTGAAVQVDTDPSLVNESTASPSTQTR